MNIRRLICLLAAVVMTMVLGIPAHAASVENMAVVSAPLRRAADVQDGMVRVWLESIGDVSKLDVTVTGRYSINGNTALTLTDGQTASIGFNKLTGKITITMNGETYAVGSEMRLRRHQTSGESALSIAQASRPKNLYPGDLRLLAVKKSDGTYRLYPIVHVYLEYYLYGVVPYEMGSSYPLEALKAQAVAARTYTMRAMNARAAYNYDLRDTSADQVYKGYTGSVSNATKAVDATKGIVIMNNGVLSGTYYTASNGGQTESVKNAWGSSGYPYMKVKDDPFDALNTSSNRRRLTVYSDFNHASQKAALVSLLTEKAKTQLGADAVIQTIHSITPHTPKYAAPSRLYTKMDFQVTALVGGSPVRATLSFDIFDDLEIPLSMSINGGQNELWSVEKTEEGFRIIVGRWGHGIGMSQRGAQQMDRMGYTYDQVLGFYYEGCDRVQFTFTHTILPAAGSNPIISTEPPAEITPAEKNQATVSLPGVNDTAPLRYTASKSGKILVGVPNGSVVTVLNKGESWSLVRYGEINGYLPTSALVMTGTSSSFPGGSATMINGWGVVSGTNALNFRSGPGYEYEYQTELGKGTILSVLETVGEWAKVQYGNRVGYVLTKFLTIHNEYPAETTGDSSAMVSLKNTSDTAPLLKSPSTSAAVIKKISHGTQVTVLTNDGSWCRVKAAGQEGYLLTSQLDFHATGVTPTDVPDPQEMTAIVNSNASTLNLREGPSKNDRVKGRIPKGTTIVVTRFGETWCAVRWGEHIGYAMTKFLLFSQQTSSPEVSQSPTPSPSASPNIWGVVSGTNALNFRSGPGYKYKSQAQLGKGTILSVLETVGEWAKVQYGSRVGYVSLEFLTIHNKYPAETTGDSSAMVSLKNTSDTAPLLKSPSTSAAVIKKISHGTQVTVLTNDGSWCRVKAAGQEGYLLTSQLDFHAAGVTPTDAPDPQEKTAIVNSNASTLNLREGPSKNDRIKAHIPKGTTIVVTRFGETWCAVRWGEHSGYAMTKFLLFNQQTSSPEVSQSPTPSPSASPNTWGVVSGTNALNFRSGPGYKYKSQAQLKKGSILRILETVGEWVKVQYGSRVGYVSLEFLTIHNKYPAETTGDSSAMVSLKNTSDTAPLRKSPSTSATVIKKISHGTQVTVLTNDGSWCRVKVAGQEGYLLTSQLDFHATGVTPTDAPDPQEKTAIVNSNASTLNLREGPSTDDRIKTQIPKGTTIVVTRFGETWCVVRWGEHSGYVMTKFLLFNQ